MDITWTLALLQMPGSVNDLQIFKQLQLQIVWSKEIMKNSPMSHEMSVVCIANFFGVR